MSKRRKQIRHSTYGKLRKAMRRAGFPMPTRKTAQRNGVLKRTGWGSYEIMA